MIIVNENAKLRLSAKVERCPTLAKAQEYV